ncbi:radial spoke head 10 homolog B isoform X2 [Archocentrus centrarchus]|uniref:radial spoke head 10 homolog B isoform X2 n=1 Tax=Archocentrus centrarchus TaxID=63155 RepID=UPI0011EA493F|nr:radial spoke head 10 homolog B2 isoform X2 [Archocentrus centrarchus]
MMPKTEEGGQAEKSASQTDLHSPDRDEPEEDSNYELPPAVNLIVQRHEGETCEGQFQGQGVVYFEGGHIYKGVFSKGLMHGPGVFTQAGGLKYEGAFVCNIPMGWAIYTWPDGSTYKGEVYNGIRHGMGTYKCAQNSVYYSGEWHQGKRHGKGMTYYNKDKTSWYKGDWVKNNREGWGVRCYPSGNIYSGEWKNNQRHGDGTMSWLKLGQKYVGAWQDGVQHGQGTHVWNLRRGDGSQYSQSNRYTGDFVQGQRHGQGTFYYAGGAIYEGGWKNNKKHGQGKLTFNDRRVFEGEFVDDQMIACNLSGSGVPNPFDSASSLLGPDKALNIDYVLDKIPARKRDTERKQVEFVVLRQERELRSICSFYSRLGCAHCPDNTHLLSRLQLWRLLKDCNVHHHGITLTQIDRIIREDADSAEIHSPFTPVPLHKLVRFLVIVAYHIYSTDMVSQKNPLAECFSKLLTDDILPNAKNVKGFLFRQPGSGVVALNYLKRCWEVFQAFCTATRDEQTMTCRHLLWMFKDLRLLDNKLTTRRLLEIINAESHDPSNLSASLELEITFLEFFEVLLGCAEVTWEQVSETLKEDHPVSRSDTEASRGQPQVEASEEMMQTTNCPSQSTGLPSAQDVGSQPDVKTEVNMTPQSAEHTEDEAESVCTPAENQTKDCKLELMTQMVDQFFNHIFFPAFDHYQLMTRTIKEEKHHQELQRQITLDRVQQEVK